MICSTNSGLEKKRRKRGARVAYPCMQCTVLCMDLEVRLSTKPPVTNPINHHHQQQQRHIHLTENEIVKEVTFLILVDCCES